MMRQLVFGLVGFLVFCAVFVGFVRILLIFVVILRCFGMICGLSLSVFN